MIDTTSLFKLQAFHPFHFGIFHKTGMLRLKAFYMPIPICIGMIVIEHEHWNPCLLLDPTMVQLIENDNLD